jgi:hypothetical protein
MPLDPRVVPILAHYKQQRHSYADAQESASWYALNGICIILENTEDPDAALDSLSNAYGRSTTQDGREFYADAWNMLRNALRDSPERKRTKGDA